MKRRGSSSELVVETELHKVSSLIMSQPRRDVHQRTSLRLAELNANSHLPNAALKALPAAFALRGRDHPAHLAGSTGVVDLGDRAPRLSRAKSNQPFKSRKLDRRGCERNDQLRLV